MLVVQVTKVCQPLDDLRDLAGSDSVDTFVLSYTSLLQVTNSYPATQQLSAPAISLLWIVGMSHESPVCSTLLLWGELRFQPLNLQPYMCPADGSRYHARLGGALGGIPAGPHQSRHQRGRRSHAQPHMYQLSCPMM